MRVCVRTPPKESAVSTPIVPTDRAVPTRATASTSQPTGLYALFFAEAWERFSYYGMRALLVLYMTKHLKFDKPQALAIYGTYTGLVYLTPFLGGILADKFLGRRKAVVIGGIVMALGHLAMAFEPLLYPALGLLIVGNGFFKPNISTIVGGLYEEGDTRRDAGFTIFYMGINLGAFFSPIVCGALGEKVGWDYGFSAAGIGMVIGLGVFLWGQRFFGTVGLPPTKPGTTAATSLVVGDWVHIAIGSLASVGLVFGTIRIWPSIGPVFWSVFNAIPLPGRVLVGLAILIGPMLGAKLDKTEWTRVAVIYILCFFNIFFWMGFEQAGGTMTIFADEQTNRASGPLTLVAIGSLLAVCSFAIKKSTEKESSGQWLWKGLTAMFGVACVYYFVQAGRALTGTPQADIPASMFQAINPLFIVAFAPFIGSIWTRLDSDAKTRTSSAVKMAIGMVILGLGFVVMYIGQKGATGGAKIGPQWLLCVYALHTLGELCLSPIGLSMVTKLSAPRILSLMMGVWFLSSAAANKLAGSLEHIVEERHLPVYGVLIATSIGAALVLLVLSPVLKKWMHGGEDAEGARGH